MKLETPAVRASQPKAKTKPGLGELSAPSRIVCAGTGHLLVIGGEKSQSIDRFELAVDAGSPAAFAG